METERGKLEEFNKFCDLYLKDKADKDNNKTKRICEYLLNNFYKSPESRLKGAEFPLRKQNFFCDFIS